MATGTVLRELYEGESRRAVRFRYGLLLFDLSTIIYLAATSFVGGSPLLELIDAVCGGSPERLITSLLDYRGLTAEEASRIEALIQAR